MTTPRTLSDRLRNADGVGACLSGDAQFICRLCNEAADALDEAVRALEAVEEWWLRDGMHHHTGAPYAIFATRATLAKLKATKE